MIRSSTRRQGRMDRWQLAAAAQQPPASLLPRSIPYVGRCPARRWAMVRPVARGVSTSGPGKPDGAFDCRARRSRQRRHEPPGVAPRPCRGHEELANRRIFAFISWAIRPSSHSRPWADPTRPAVAAGPQSADAGRSSLILRRGSTQGQPLSSTFVTLFEPGIRGFLPCAESDASAPDRTSSSSWSKTRQGPNTCW